MSALRQGIEEVLVTAVDGVVLAFDARRVERVEEMSAGTHETVEDNVLDSRTFLGLSQPSGGAPAQQRRVVTFNGVAPGARLVAGDDLCLEPLTSGSLLAPPPFLGALWRRFSVQQLLTYGRRIALLIDVDSLFAEGGNGRDSSTRKETST